MPSSGSVETRSCAFYEGIAEEYDRLLDTPRARGMRECFWRQAEAVLPASARILDFGAGTGIDAEHFAALGHRVTAYDVAEGMVAVLARRCAAQVNTGAVVPLCGTIETTGPALAARAPYDAVICNFAVLSLIPRLDDLFGLWGALVRPGGHALVCIENPWWPEDMRRLSFWRSLLMLPVRGVMRVSSPGSGHLFRHTPAQVRRAAAPEFLPDARPDAPCCREHFGARSRMRLVTLCRR